MNQAGESSQVTAMALKKGNPPVFSENMLYKTLRNKIDMWKLITSVPKKEQAIIILFDSLEGNTKAKKNSLRFNCD